MLGTHKQQQLAPVSAEIIDVQYLQWDQSIDLFVNKFPLDHDEDE